MTLDEIDIILDAAVARLEKDAAEIARAHEISSLMGKRMSSLKIRIDALRLMKSAPPLEMVHRMNLDGPYFVKPSVTVVKPATAA